MAIINFLIQSTVLCENNFQKKKYDWTAWMTFEKRKQLLLNYWTDVIKKIFPISYSFNLLKSQILLINDKRWKRRRKKRWLVRKVLTSKKLIWEVLIDCYPLTFSMTQTKSIMLPISTWCSPDRLPCIVASGTTICKFTKWDTKPALLETCNKICNFISSRCAWWQEKRLCNMYKSICK